MTAPPVARLLAQPCTLISTQRGSSVDEYGDPIPAETTTAAVCLLQQQQATEDGNIQVSKWRVFLSPAHEMGGWDAIEVAGERYALDGDSWPVLDALTGEVHHVEAVVTRTR